MTNNIRNNFILNGYLIFIAANLSVVFKSNKHISTRNLMNEKNITIHKKEVQNFY